MKTVILATVAMTAIIAIAAIMNSTATVEAQTGNPKQAVIFDMQVDMRCNDAEPIYLEAQHGVRSVYGEWHESRDFLWRSWTAEDKMYVMEDGVGFLHLLDGSIDRNTDTYVVKGLFNPPDYSCPPAKITIKGACDSSTYEIIYAGQRVPVNASDRFEAACYGN